MDNYEITYDNKTGITHYIFENPIDELFCYTIQKAKENDNIVNFSEWKAKNKT